MIKPVTLKSGQKMSSGALPKADTCFFNLELPNYSTKEMLKEKLVYAIHTDCVSMNAEAEMVRLVGDAGDIGEQEFSDGMDEY